MIVLFIIIWSIGTIILGRIILGAWFNHISMYSGIWGFSLFLFCLSFIPYYPLESITWTFIIAAWAAFILGSITIIASKYSENERVLKIENKAKEDTLISIEQENRILFYLLLGLNSVTLIITIQHWFTILHVFGSIPNVIVLGSILRTALVHNEIPGMWPYGSSLTLTAMVFAGIYTTNIGKAKIIVIISILILIFDEIAGMGRGKMIIGGVLFISGYMLNKYRRNPNKDAIARGSFGKYISIIVILILLIAGAEVVRSNRGMIEQYKGASQPLKKLQHSSIITPSIYVYFTAHYGVFNKYLKENSEKGIWGRYSLAPILRMMSRIGFNTSVDYYQPFYNIPIYANTGTYLRELHVDYGVSGTVIAPYLLGIISSIYWFRVKKYKRIIDVMILGHILVIIFLSFVLMATQFGYLLISLLCGLIISYFIDRLVNKVGSSIGIQKG